MNQNDIPSPSGDSDDDGNRPDPFPYSESEDMVLPEDYTPTKHDVINGRGRKSYNHIANRRFRQLISMSLERYLSARCKVDKTLVVVGIVDSIRNAKPTGGFLKRCPKTARWISMSDESAREKVGHCLRDMIASQRDGKDKGTKSPKKGKVLAGAAGPGSPPLSAKSPGKNVAKNMTSPNGNNNPNHNQNLMMNNPWITGPPPDGTHPVPPHQFPPHHPMHAGGPAAMMAGQSPFAMWSAMHHAAAMAHHQGRHPYGHHPDFYPNNNPNNKDGPPLPPLHAPGQAALPGLAGKDNNGKANNKKNKSNNKDEDPPPLHNAESLSLQKGGGNMQDMSEQQRRILLKLEAGYKGTVEELMESVK